MAPEIFIHDKYDTKADVWALGSLLFELLTFQRVVDHYNPSFKRFEEKLNDGIIYLPYQ